jgi:hypothetical protein
VEAVEFAGAAGKTPSVVGEFGGYGALAAVRRRLSAGGDGVRGGYGVRVLHAYETDPDVWRTRLLQVLASGLEMDEEILGAARAVLRADRRTGHVIVDVVGS